MKTLLKYDFLFLWKTKKYIIFPVIFGLFAMMSPLLAYYLPEIINMIPATEGISIQMPPATVGNAYVQYFADMNETVLFIVIFVAISVFTKEKTSGLLIQLFSKPVSKKKYILSKYISFIALLFASLLVAILCFSFYTYIIFDEMAVGAFLLANITQFSYFAFIIAVCLFFSVTSKSYLTALLQTFGVYVGLFFFSIFNVAPFKYLPVALVGQSANILFDNVNSNVLWISLSGTLIITILLVFFSVKIIRKQDILK